jgi:hypothetical protein
MDCPECVHLLAECERLNEAYTVAFETMIEHCRAIHGTNFTVLKIAADDAWFAAERARLKLQEHKRRHAGGELSRAVGR